MTLSDVKKITARKNLCVRFALRNGMECVVNQHGVAQVPALNAVPDFNLEEEFSKASAFTVAPATGEKIRPRSVSREELASMVGSAPVASADHDDSDE